MKKIRLIIPVIFLFLSSCGDDRPDAIIPYRMVMEDINLNNLQYANLKNPGGFVYMAGGYRGLLIYHEVSGVYRVFDRACTHDPASDCDPLEVDTSGLFIKHSCCSSSFSFDGNPLSGPARLRLLQYDSRVEGIYLIIRN